MLLSKGFCRTTWQVQIDISLTHRRLADLRCPFGLRSTDLGAMPFSTSVRGHVRSTRLRARHLSHDAPTAFAFLPVFLPLREARNLRRRSDLVLDRPLVDKIHTPSVIEDHGWLGYRRSVLLRRTHSSRMQSFGSNAGPSNCWLLLLPWNSNLYQPLFTQKRNEDHRQADDL